jgi:hypothetical protein
MGSDGFEGDCLLIYGHTKPGELGTDVDRQTASAVVIETALKAA